MRYYKRFSDFCGGVSAFFALMYLFTQYMSFHPVNVESTKEKLLRFFEEGASKDYRSYLLLVLLLVGALVIGNIFSRFPSVGFLASLFPMAQAMMMLREGKLYERPMQHILLGLLFCLGFVADALMRDRVDGKRRAYTLTNLCGVVFALVGVAVSWRSRKLLATELSEEAIEALSYADLSIYHAAETEDVKILLTFSALIAATVLISLLLRDIYFLDSILAVGPLVYIIYLFHAEKLTLFPMAILILAAFYFICRMLVMHFEPMRLAKKKEK